MSNSPVQIPAGVGTEFKAPESGRRPSFHVFAMHGDYVLFDVVTNQAVLTDALTHELLESVERTGDWALAITDAETRHGVQAVSETLEDLDILARECQFFTAEPPPPEGGREYFTDVLSAHEPRGMMVLVSRACNLKCTYCYEVLHDWHKPGAMMSTSDARRVFDDLLERSGSRPGVTVTFFGGEALLNPGVIRDTVAYARERAAEAGKRVGFTLTTNGVLLDEEMMDFLVEHEFGVMLSLDGEEEGHDRYRRDLGGRGTHVRAAANGKRLLAKQLAAGVRPLKLRATLSKENAERQAVADYFEREFPGARYDIGATSAAESAVSAADIDCSSLTDMPAELDEAVMEALREVRDGRRPHQMKLFTPNLSDLVDALESDEPVSAAMPKLCGIGRNMRAVEPSGDTYPCHRFVGMENFRLREGFDGDPDVERARIAELYRSIYDKFERTCATCWVRYRCGGQCTWYMARDDGSLSTPPEHTCEMIRRGWERTVWLLLRLGQDAPEALERSRSH